MGVDDARQHVLARCINHLIRFIGDGSFRGFDNLAIPDHDILLRDAATADHHTIGNDEIGLLFFHDVSAFREFI